MFKYKINVSTFFQKPFLYLFLTFSLQWNGVIATNSNFTNILSLQPDGVNLGYFKFRLFDPA